MDDDTLTFADVMLGEHILLRGLPMKMTEHILLRGLPMKMTEQQALPSRPPSRLLLPLIDREARSSSLMVWIHV